MPSFRKEIRTLASRAVDGLKKEVKGHFTDLPPWEDYDPDIIERYEEKLQRRERRQRRRAEASESDAQGHIYVTTQHTHRRHAKEHQHRQRRRQVNEHYNRSSTQHKDEREHKHGVPRVVEPEHGAGSPQRSSRVRLSEPSHDSPSKTDAEKLSHGERSTAAPPAYFNYQIPEEEMVPCYEHKEPRRSFYAMTAKELSCNGRTSIASPEGINNSKMKEQEVPSHEHKDTRRSFYAMTAKELSCDERPSIPPRRGSKHPLKTEQGDAPLNEHKSSSRVSDRPIEPKNANDHAEEFRPLKRTPSSVYSSYSDDEQRTVIGNQPATQEPSTLGGQDHYSHQPISQQDDGIWEDDLDDWKSEEEELLTTIKETHDKLNQHAKIENWRNEVWEGNPEPCSDPSFVSEPRPQSTLERIGNIRLANMSTASVTTRFSEFC